MKNLPTSLTIKVGLAGFICASTSLLLLAGCGSSTPAKGTYVPKKPSYYRVANFTDSEVVSLLDSRSEVSAGPGVVVFPNIISKGEHTIKINFDGKELDSKTFTLEPGSLVTFAVVKVGGKPTVVQTEGEAREADPGKSGVSIVNLTAKPQTFEVNGKTVEAAPGPKATTVPTDAGVIDVQFVQGGKKVALDVPSSDQGYAGILVHEAAGKVETVIKDNREKLKPSAQGGSAAG